MYSKCIIELSLLRGLFCTSLSIGNERMCSRFIQAKFSTKQLPIDGAKILRKGDLPQAKHLRNE